MDILNYKTRFYFKSLLVCTCFVSALSCATTAGAITAGAVNSTHIVVPAQNAYVVHTGDAVGNNVYARHHSATRRHSHIHRHRGMTHQHRHVHPHTRGRTHVRVHH